MTLFSKRYQRAIQDKLVTVPTVPVRARTRIWMLMEQFTTSWQEVDDSNWSSWTNSQEKTELRLKREYGERKLIAYVGDGDQRGSVNFETFLQRCSLRLLRGVICGLLRPPRRPPSPRR